MSVSIPQKVSDFSSCMVVENQEVCLACFLRLEKYEVPEVRDYYNGMISHLVQELNIALHRVSDLDELKKLTQPYEDEDDFFEGADVSFKPQPKAEAQPKTGTPQMVFESTFADGFEEFLAGVLKCEAKRALHCHLGVKKVFAVEQLFIEVVEH